MKINIQIHDPAGLPPKEYPTGEKAVVAVVPIKIIFASDFNKIPGTQSIVLVNLREKE
jgi:hypothetical protein